jgi:hypothetical protein
VTVASPTIPGPIIPDGIFIAGSEQRSTLIGREARTVFISREARKEFIM